MPTTNKFLLLCLFYNVQASRNQFNESFMSTFNIIVGLKTAAYQCLIYFSTIHCIGKIHKWRYATRWSQTVFILGTGQSGDCRGCRPLPFHLKPNASSVLQKLYCNSIPNLRKTYKPLLDWVSPSTRAPSCTTPQQPTIYVFLSFNWN